MPADLPQESQLDPERILGVLPERERATFLDEYERAIDEARDRVRAGDRDGMLLDDAVRARRSA